MLVMYKASGESLITTIDNEETMVKHLINEEHGRDIKNYKRVEGDIFVLNHTSTVYYTCLEE